MKKGLILILLIIIAGVFLAACERSSVSYCPYCSYSSISEVESGVYKCNRCEKTFGAKEIL